MLLSSLWIRNFRVLEDFHVSTLGRVNLIVGKNNSGKSTVLEALRILAKQAHPELLRQILDSHDESWSNKSPESIDDQRGTEKAYQHFFPNRTFPVADDSGIYIGDEDQKEFVQINHVNFSDDVDEIRDEQGEITRLRKRRIVSKSQIPISTADEYLSQALLVTSNRSPRQGWIDLQSPRYLSSRPGLFWEDAKECAVSHVPTQFLPRDYLATLWDSVALTDGDEQLTKALKLIDSDVQGIAFVQREAERNGRRRTAEDRDRIAIVKLASHSSPIPLNSMGDGMLRMLQLVLTLFPARGGIMLIDEFENGLHYSVQEHAWNLIFRLAAKFKVQVFATTHSWDCIAAFKTAALEAPDKGVLFRVGRSVRKSNFGKVVATTFSENELLQLTQSEVEVR